jgi:XTP/dITP diphosphohydrolase
VKAPTLVLATGNRHKVAEILLALGSLPLRILSLADFPEAAEVDEDADDYAGNARKKAVACRAATGFSSLADDSGLEVEALGGAPGVRSKRFGGDAAAFGEKMAMLLAALEGKAEHERAARFRCAVALALADGRVVVEEAACEGRIAGAPRGAGGFGYDPIFVDSTTGRTFAEMAPEEKLPRSHRGRALAKIRPALEALAR